MSQAWSGPKRRVRVAVGALSVVLMLAVVGCGSSDGVDSTDDTMAEATKVDKLTLVAPPGPMAIPMAYLVVNDRLTDVAEEVELVIWENGDQLKAMVAGGQGDFVTVPSNNAATFYNKGVQIQLLDISVWNITYLVSSDPDVASFTDIQGQSLVVSLQGSVPDVMFQYLAAAEGLDPETDFDLRYATDPTQAAQSLLSGQVQNAVLSEALATKVLQRSEGGEIPLYRAFAFDVAWAGATGGSAGGEAATPIAGVVATASILDQPEVIAAFEREYAAAVEWLVANPDQAGQLVEDELPQLGLEAAVMTASLQNIMWEHKTAAEAKDSLAAFYAELLDLAPEVVGGMLPDDGFYYAP